MSPRFLTSCAVSLLGVWGAIVRLVPDRALARLPPFPYRSCGTDAGQACFLHIYAFALSGGIVGPPTPQRVPLEGMALWLQGQGAAPEVAGCRCKLKSPL